MATRSREGRRVPVVVLAGFLGAGKTTLLNHLLRASTGVRIGVVVNDFGSVNIDAMLVSSYSADAVALQNGCVCCALGDDSLDDVLGRLTAVEAGLDVVVVEASGVAEPRALVSRVANAPGVAWGGLVLVVDAVELVGTLERHPEVVEHLAEADVIVITKTDLADAVPVEALCRSASAAVPLVRAVHGSLDPRLLLDPDVLAAARERPGRQLVLGEDDHHDHAGHLHTAYETVQLLTDDPLDGPALRALLDDRPPGLFRVKGFVDLGDEGWWTVHVVGRQVQLTAGVPRGVRATSLVCLGAGMDTAAVHARLQSCTGRRTTTRRQPGGSRLAAAHGRTERSGGSSSRSHP